MVRFSISKAKTKIVFSQPLFHFKVIERADQVPLFLIRFC